MNLKLLSILAITSLAWSAIALPSPAQTGNGSDITGAIVTGSDITGGGFAPFGGSGGLFFSSKEVGDAVNIAATSINTELASQTFQVAATNNITIPRSIQIKQTLVSLLTNAENADASAIQLQNSLENIAGAPDPTAIRNLVSSLKGLTASDKVNPAQFVAVINAYNAIIDRSNDQFLNNMPEELRTVQSVLSSLLTAAYSTK